jgi:hypothetical protein
MLLLKSLQPSKNNKISLKLKAFKESLCLYLGTRVRGKCYSQIFLGLKIRKISSIEGWSKWMPIPVTLLFLRS